MAMGCLASCNHELLISCKRPTAPLLLRKGCCSSKAWLRWERPPLSISRKTILNTPRSSVAANPHIFSRADEANGDNEKGLGIVEFLRGKNFLITGCTGFVAKVLMEKILRVQPDVGQIFLLLRPKDQYSLEERFSKEVINCDLFRTLKDVHGKDFEGFIKSKISLIMGDTSLPNLGIDFDTIKQIKNQVHVIVNSAAATTFFERYDISLSTNTRGAYNVVQFSKLITSLQLLMHVSSAYVNGHKEGLVNECPLTLEEVIPTDENTRNKMRSFHVASREEEIVQRLKMELPATSNKSLALKNLGMERSTRCGFHNTYVFTKALGELLIDEARNDLPVVIVRPTMISSTIMDPLKGWIEGSRLGDPIILSYAKGQIHGFVGEPSSIVDLVPVDMVANAMLAMITKHASQRGLEVYHFASSSSQKPLIYRDLMDFTYHYFSQNPYMENSRKSIKINPFIYHSDISMLIDDESQHLKPKDGKSSIRKEKLLEYIHSFADIYKPYTFIKCRFDCSRTMKLHGNLSHSEKKSFFFNVEDVNWEHFIKNVHIPGLQRHILKNRGVEKP